MVGGGAAALTGLVFVGLSLNVTALTGDAMHRNRAIGTLTGFGAAFVTCALMLMGSQSYRTMGVDWLTVAVVAGIVHVRGIRFAAQSGVSRVGHSRGRFVFGTGCYLAEIVGAALMVADREAGIFVAATAMTILIAYMITGAWLLIVGVGDRLPSTQ